MPSTRRSELRLGAAFLVIMITMSLAACERRPEETGDAVVPAAEAPPMAPDGTPPPGTVPALAPGEITGILIASDSLEIKPSEIALQKAEHPDVKAFAERVLSDYKMLEDSIQAIAARQNITPQPTNVSEQLESQAASTVQRLEGLSGNDFDRAYIDAMIESHQAALERLDKELLPATEDPTLRAEMEREVRPVIVAHLEVAKEVKDTLEGHGGAAR